MPIFKHSEHDFIPRLAWARRHDKLVQRIISNANNFAMQYTTYKARVLYWKYVLLAYRSLVPDMDEYFEKEREKEEQQKKRMESILTAQLAAVTGKEQPAAPSKTG